MKSEAHETLPPTELPVPEIKTPQVPEQGHELTKTTELGGATAVEVQPRGSIPASANPLNTPKLLPSQQASSPPVGVKTSLSQPQIADDEDLIEKEWVQKAKAIVANTKQDPYNQNKEMSIYKADYVKKRFNKDIKISSES